MSRAGWPVGGERDHARGHGEHGDPDAGESPQDVCGSTGSEADALLPGPSAGGRLESGDPGEDELTGEQAGGRSSPSVARSVRLAPTPRDRSSTRSG